MPVLAHEGVAVAAALGTSTLLVRLPTAPPKLKVGLPDPSLADHGWQEIDAWQAELPSAEGDRRLAGVIRGALANARDLSP